MHYIKNLQNGHGKEFQKHEFFLNQEKIRIFQTIAIFITEMLN